MCCSVPPLWSNLDREQNRCHRLTVKMSNPTTMLYFIDFIHFIRYEVIDLNYYYAVPLSNLTETTPHVSHHTSRIHPPHFINQPLFYCSSPTHSLKSTALIPLPSLVFHWDQPLHFTIPQASIFSLASTTVLFNPSNVPHLTHSLLSSLSHHHLFPLILSFPPRNIRGWT